MAFPHTSCYQPWAPGAVCCMQLGQGCILPRSVGFLFWYTEYKAVSSQHPAQVVFAMKVSFPQQEAECHLASLKQLFVQRGALQHPSEGPSITNFLYSLSIQCQHSATKNEVFQSVPLVQKGSDQPALRISKGLCICWPQNLPFSDISREGDPFPALCCNTQHSPGGPAGTA